MYLNHHKDKWDELHHMDIFQPKYPTEAVVRFVKTTFPNPQSYHLLDLGCGAGRHVVFLASEGYQVTGVDFSEIGLKAAKEELEQRQLRASLVKSSILAMPFLDEQFDGIISYGVLIYFNKQDLQQALREMHRVLKPGGKAFMVVRSILDKRYGQGTLVEKDTFAMNNLNEEALMVHYFNQNEIEEELFKHFSEVKLGFTHEGLESTQVFNGNYLITVTK